MAVCGKQTTMGKRRAEILLLLVVLFVLPGPSAHAWLRTPYEDAVIVERSELIVVARLNPQTIRCVQEKGPTRGAPREFHATLLVSQVIKGKLEEKETPIIIHYGLTPVVGGYIKTGNMMINLRRGRKDYPAHIVEILDTGSSAGSDEPLVKDAAKDNLWFLRKSRSRISGQPKADFYSIRDPEEVQPVALKAYFEAYLADDPEKAVAEHLAKTPQVKARVRRYLDHLEVQRILKIADPLARATKLLPFYLKRARWGMTLEVRKGMIQCGKVAGGLLRPAFEDRKHPRMRRDVILVWREMGYKACEPLLIELLKENEKYWVSLDLKGRKWNADSDSDRGRRSSGVYRETYYSVHALGKIGTGRAREAILLARQRWIRPNFDSKQIVEECDKALARIAQRRLTDQAEGGPGAESAW